MGLLDTATKPLEQAGRLGRFAAGKGIGLVSEVRGRVLPRPKDLNDPAIAHKVETEVFRPRSVPKGSIDINVVDGVVWLRGVAKNPAQVRAIEARARAIPEVVDVENLLHLPGTPAPTRTDTPAPLRKETGRAKRRPPPAPHVERPPVNADKTSPRTGESPVELAEQRKGRQPAKLGTDDS
jgi:hypothetical protein